MINRALFSSVDLKWRTPKALYEELDREFHFDFDPCPANPTFDGLTIEWGNMNYVNPPYGKWIGRWLLKGLCEYSEGRRSVFLLPSRTGTKWFQCLALPFATEIRFIEGRLIFEGATNSAPFDSCEVVF